MKKSYTFRLGEHTVATIDNQAQIWHIDRTAALERIVLEHGQEGMAVAVGAPLKTRPPAASGKKHPYAKG